MADQSPHAVIRLIRKLTGKPAGPEASDQELLGRFIDHQDKAAFAALLQRHGLMVRGVCRCLLRQEADAADAFQATFLVLLQKASSIRKRPSLASWLHGVACRTTGRARTANAPRQAAGSVPGENVRGEPWREAAWRELCAVLDGAVQAQPQRYRAPLVLCYLEGRTRDQAAAQLGSSLRTLDHRLEPGRQLLRTRLLRQGVTFSAALLATGLSQQVTAAVPASLLARTLEGVAPWAAGKVATAAGLLGRVAALAEGARRAMAVAWLQAALALALAVSLAAGALARQALAARQPPGKQEAAPKPPIQVGSSPRPEPQARTDRYGDPLPKGAIARLGTVRLRHRQVYRVVFSPDGKVLASGGDDHKVVFWDPVTGKELRSFVVNSDFVDAVAFSPDGKLLASGSQDAEIRLWQTATGKELRRMKGHTSQVLTVAFSPDGRLLTSGGGDNAVCVWDVGTGKELERFQEPQGHYIHAVAFSPDGKILAAARSNGKVDLWQVPTWKHAGSLKGHKGRVTALAFAPDGKVLFTGAFDTTVRFWDVAARKERHRLGEVKEPTSGYDPGIIECLAVSPDGRRVAAGRQDGTLSVWDTATGQELRRWEADHVRAISLAFSPDGKSLASASRNGIQLWDPKTGRRLDPFTEPSGWPEQLSWSPDGKVLAAVYDGQILRLFDAGSWKERVSITLPKPRLSSLAFSPDGRVLAFVELGGPEGRLESTIRLLEVATGKDKGVAREEHRLIQQIAFSPRGDILAGAEFVASTGSREFILWDSVSGKERHRFPGPRPGETGSGLSFSPDGRILATAGQEEAVSLWDPATGKKIRGFGRRERNQWFLAFSPDAKTVALAGKSRRPARGSPEEATDIILWETATGQERCRLRGHEQRVTAAVFSPDGRIMVSSAMHEEPIRLWDAATSEEIGQLTGHRS